MPKIVEVHDDMPVNPVGVGVPKEGKSYPVIMGDYSSAQAKWEPIALESGTPLSKPKPLIAKLDPELGQTGPEWAPAQQG